MARYRRSRHRRGSLLGRFYLNPSVQYIITILSAILFAVFIFSGFLLFRYADSSDLIARGKRQLEVGKVALATKTFENLVNRYPDSYEGFILLGKSYLELNERIKAEKAFQKASALRTGASSEQQYEADVALSKLAMIRQEFDRAETKLLQAKRKNRNDPQIKQALFELYEQWGDYALDKAQDPLLAIDKYDRALRYVAEYRLEDALKDKLIETIGKQADTWMVERKTEQAVRLLKKSLQYRYLPDTLITIAEIYERNGNLDAAISWYRKAFDANPELISIKLANMLIKKGRSLLDDKKTEEAEKLFEEADRISQLAKLPMDVLYPVKTREVSLSVKTDADTNEFKPKVKLLVENKSERRLNFLAVKAVFYSGEDAIGEAQQVVATLAEPLEPVGTSGKDRKKITIVPDQMLALDLLKTSTLTVKLFIAYVEGAHQDWLMKSVQEIKVSKPSAEATTPAEPSGEPV